jgi:hypothetical protein
MGRPNDSARALIGSGLLGILVLVGGCMTTGGTPVAVHTAPPPRTRARLEPISGTYFGVNLDWANDSAAAFAQRVARPAAVYVAFAHFPISGDDDAYLDGFVNQVLGQGGLALLTLEPAVALDSVTPDLAARLADRLARYNTAGVPVMVRFAHEMNGSWYAWSQQPAAYVRAFRTIAAAVHARASQSAMLWAPNYGAGYPFNGGPYQAQPDNPDFGLLDTNRDGVVDGKDDPYAPYYPGDDAVDWVGMTLYHWGDRWPWGRNIVPEEGKFVSQLTGSYNGVGGDQRGLPDFYQVYAEGHAKPMAIPETAAFYNPSVGGDGQLDIKQAWWRQVFSEDVARLFPDIKMINWFEWRKSEAEVDGALVDWTATLDPTIRNAFVADLPTERFLFGTTLPPHSELAHPVASPERTPQPLPTPVVEASRRIQFGGYSWHVRDTSSLEGPGPNYFSSAPEHVWVDDAGRLHLRVAPDSDGRWYAAEVASEASPGYGTYRFTLDSRVDNLDQNAALGLFTWSDDPAQNHRELDVEFAHFGHPDAPVGRYTLQPYTDPDNVSLFEQTSASPSTHAFIWSPDQVTFMSWIGAQKVPPAESEGITQHTFTGAVPDPGDTHVHLNLWLDAGNPPADGQPIEIVIRDFSFSAP